MYQKNSFPTAVSFVVEIAYATPKEQVILSVAAQAMDNVRAVIERSGILQKFPEIDLSQQTVGIFSKPCELTDIVHPADRIEIYRPLTIDPKESRRLRAKNKMKKK